jgi:DedD protein
MIVPGPNRDAGFSILEAHRQSLRRQIGIVVTLTLLLSVALAVLSLFPRRQTAGIDKAPESAMREIAVAAGTLAPAPGPVAATAAPPPAEKEPALAPVVATTDPVPATPSPSSAAAAVPAAPLAVQTTTVAASDRTAAKPADDQPPRASLKADDGATGRRHFVQLGIFMQPSNAETLRARLQQQGIPALLETRVRVGPFATREEALAAQARLRDLGFEPGAVVPLKP